jgi:hypothetical protein
MIRIVDDAAELFVDSRQVDEIGNFQIRSDLNDQLGMEVTKRHSAMKNGCLLTKKGLRRFGTFKQLAPSLFLFDAIEN